LRRLQAGNKEPLWIIVAGDRPISPKLASASSPLGDSGAQTGRSSSANGRRVGDVAQQSKARLRINARVRAVAAAAAS
jgi:hypothetical protein